MRFLCAVGLLFLFITDGSRGQEPASIVIDARQHHLGLPGMPEWQEFERSAAEGPQLDLTFTSRATATESTLFIRQRNVKTTWNVLVNGRKIGALETLTQPLVLALAIPPGVLTDGENRLSIVRPPSRQLDDIVVGEIVLQPRSRDDVLADATLEIAVTDAEAATGLPCRLTLVDAEEALAPWRPAGPQQLAVRTGVVYTGDGKARMGVR